jgi:hypothetical protein
MSSERLKRNLSTLDVLCKASRPQREAIIETATRDQILCICDCANNILAETVPLTDKQLRQLKRYQSLIRYLGETKNHKNTTNKKKFINQSGGFLPLLLTPILSAAASILAETLIKK